MSYSKFVTGITPTKYYGVPLEDEGLYHGATDNADCLKNITPRKHDTKSETIIFVPAVTGRKVITGTTPRNYANHIPPRKNEYHDGTISPHEFVQMFPKFQY